MDKGLCLSKEHSGDRRHSDGGFSQVTYRQYEESDLKDFCLILSEFWSKVNQEDLSQVSEYSHMAGKLITKAEAKVYHLLFERCQIQIAFDGCDMVGFLVYHLAYDCVLAVECIYILPQYENRGVGKGLIESLQKPVNKIFFQTHSENPPTRFLNLIKNKSKEIHRKGELITWEMEWLNGLVRHG